MHVCLYYSWIDVYIVEDDNDGVEELPGEERTGDKVSRSLSPSMSDDNSITVTITEVLSESELKERPVNTLEGDVEDAPHESALIYSTTNDNDNQSTDNSSSATVKPVRCTRRKSPAKCSVDKERHIATNSESALVPDSDHNNLTYAEIELDHEYEDVDFDDKPGIKLQKQASNRPLPPKTTVATKPEKQQNLITPIMYINNSRQHTPIRELPSINEDSRDCELQKRDPNSVNSTDLYYEDVTLQEGSIHEQAVPQVSNQAHATKMPTALTKVPVPVGTQNSTSEETPMHTESEDHGYENHSFDQSANPTSHEKHNVIPPRGQAGTQLNKSQDSTKQAVKKRMLLKPQPKPRPPVSKRGSLSTDNDSTSPEYENTAFKVANIPSKHAQKSDFSSLRRQPRVKTHELVQLQQQFPSISHPHQPPLSKLAPPSTDSTSDSSSQERENTAFKVANTPSKHAQKSDVSSLRRQPRVKTHELVQLQQQFPSISHPHQPPLSKLAPLSTDSTSDRSSQERENTAFKVANTPSKHAQKSDVSSLRRQPRVKTHELVQLQQKLPSISHPHIIKLERRTDFSRLATPVTQRKQHERAHTPSPGHVMPLLHPLLSNLPLSATRSDGAINKRGSTHDHEYVDEDCINTALPALSGSQNTATCIGANIRADPEYIDEYYTNTTLASITSHTSSPDGHASSKGESYVNTLHSSTPTKAEAPIDDDDLVYDYPDLTNKPFIFSASQHKVLLSPKSPPSENQFLKADSSTLSRKSGKLAKSNENISSAVKNEPNHADYRRSLSSQEDSDYVNGYVNTELSRQLPSRKKSSPKKLDKTK